MSKIEYSIRYKGARLDYFDVTEQSKRFIDDESIAFISRTYLGYEYTVAYITYIIAI